MISETDLQVIQGQLKRKINPSGSVSRYCSWNFPSVIQCLPETEQGTPFPTLYWLSCPHLRYQVDKLEQKGLVKEISAQIRSDPKLMENYRKATEVYREERSALYLTIHPGLTIPEALETGIGGIREWRNLKNLKCLHTHLAFHLINRSEIVGGILNGLSLYCPTGACAGFIQAGI
ncbi:MAG: DUF501 domain-containing protein [Candidatus Wallbacteria bacterium]|nr:DUF501 domain-containing protein [Candidatus Wallbacteria bacterium]